MRGIKPKCLWIALVTIAILIPTSIALAKELTALEVTGKGIDGTLRIDSPDDINRIQQSSLFDMGSQIAPLTGDQLAALGEGYQLTFFINEGGSGQSAYRYKMVYYPDPAGGEGYQHWLGFSKTDLDFTPSGVWTRINSRDENVFWGILQAKGVERPQARMAASPAQTIATMLPDWAWAALSGVLALILAASVLILRQRRHPKLDTLGTGRN